MSEQDRVDEQSKDRSLENYRVAPGEKLTTDEGHPISNTDDSLKAGGRGLRPDSRIYSCVCASCENSIFIKASIESGSCSPEIGEELIQRYANAAEWTTYLE